MGAQARWNLKVSQQLDTDLRVFLAERGGKKGDLSSFVEAAVRQSLLYELTNKIWDSNRNADPDEIERVVAEELRAFRAENPMDRNCWARAICES